MTLRFGTDGVRGHADELNDDLVRALGRAAGRVLAGELRGATDRRFVIGRDPRISGSRIEQALVEGLAAEAVGVELVGIAPTPAVAWIAAARLVPAAMISASHNPYHDNGVKFFAAGGLKLSDAEEELLEGELDRILASSPEPARGQAPPLREGTEDLERYELTLVNALEGRTLEGLSVVLDCANGAASGLAPRVFERLGASVTVIHARPDGRNINAGCGSTHPEDLRKAVIAAGADAGLAFDGDADRVLAVDELGELVDGDHLIALCAIDLRERGRLRHDTVVVTVMSNLGLRLAMREHGIEVVETQVGDRYVLEALEAGGFALGGEQSGHVIFRDLATTGDGILTGVHLLDVVARARRPLSSLAAEVMTTLPQVLRNVRVARRDPAIIEAVADEVAAVEAALGERGRVLVRPSGTEPLVRVMVEADDRGVAEEAARRLVAAVERTART
ncbi:phosphoglucosamine mutase [Rhabdothermincola sediminis]|uniref:phosphoglucosamine mutase n=1 Tax=Rhabdothermincola sediminis TaxID=2751370 RepID=UPI001AA0B0F8|nr:phosphoglucosamine mutase [Rhabdothermincola sediminis]